MDRGDGACVHPETGINSSNSKELSSTNEGLSIESATEGRGLRPVGGNSSNNTSGGGKMASGHRVECHEADREVGRERSEGCYQHDPLATSQVGIRPGAPRDQQSTAFGFDPDQGHFIGTSERHLKSSLLVRPASLCEVGKFGWSRGGIGNCELRHVHLGSSQDRSNNWSKITLPLLLEHRDGVRNLLPLAAWQIDGRHLHSPGGESDANRSKITLGEKDWRPSICGCRGETGGSDDDNAAQGKGDANGVRCTLQPPWWPRIPRWYCGIASTYYPSFGPSTLANREMKERSILEQWTIHAPNVPITSYDFPAEIKRFLVFDSEVNNKIFLRTIESESVREQINKSSCAIEQNHLTTLVKNKIIERLGSLGECEDRIKFVGDVFLHPEPAKKRWRLIFHPRLYNLVIRALGLHQVNLPRIRHIVKGIVENQLSVKLDLKCAFFQVPIERGTFCFRYGKSVYTLTRLPMGASTSVLIAQSLAVAVMNEMDKHLKVSLKTNAPSSKDAFVDDIFLSLNFHPKREINRDIKNAMAKVSQELNVTFKTCHFAMREFDKTKVEDRFATLDPEPHEANALCKVEPRSVLEVLGVNFCINSYQMSIKDEFKSKAVTVLSIPLDVITPHNLWKVVGTCVHVIYALGLGAYIGACIGACIGVE